MVKLPVIYSHHRILPWNEKKLDTYNNLDDFQKTVLSDKTQSLIYITILDRTKYITEMAQRSVAVRS